MLVFELGLLLVKGVQLLSGTIPEKAVQLKRARELQEAEVRGMIVHPLSVSSEEIAISEEELALLASCDNGCELIRGKGRRQARAYKLKGPPIAELKKAMEINSSIVFKRNAKARHQEFVQERLAELARLKSVEKSDG